MKRTILLFILVISGILSFAQEFTLPICFENGRGDRDTLVFGFDKSATDSMDIQFGEKNILGEPYDSSLFVFFTDAASREHDPYLERPKHSTFLSKRLILNDYQYVIEIGVVNKFWPLLISWDSVHCASFDLNTFYNSFYPGYFIKMIMTSWHPPGGWFDAGGCTRATWPNGFTLLEEKSEITVGENVFCYYHTDQMNDPVYLMYLGAESGTSAKAIKDMGFEFAYNEKERGITLFSQNGAGLSEIVLYDITGRRQSSICLEIEKKRTYNIPVLVNQRGLVLISVRSIHSNFRFNTKIIVP